MRFKLIFLPALVAGVLAAALSWWLSPWRVAAPAAPDESAGPAAVRAEAPAPAPPETTPDAAAAQADSAPRAQTAADAGAEAAARIPNLRPVEDLYFTADPNRSSGREWDFAAFRNATASADKVDAETAFAAYQYLDSCSRMPLSEQGLERRLERLQVLLEREPEAFTEQEMEEMLDHVQSGYVACGGLENVDIVAEALEWLQLAADLGEPRALVFFYRAAHSLLRRSPDRVFREPAYLDLHRAKSAEYFARALETGHPQAFRAFAAAIMDDVLYEPDPIAAYAHLYAGDLAAAGALPQITEEMERLEARLNGGDLRAARAWGRELCLQWCPRRPGS